MSLSPPLLLLRGEWAAPAFPGGPPRARGWQSSEGPLLLTRRRPSSLPRHGPPAAEERAATAGRGRGHGGLQGSRSGGELREGGGAATGGTGRPTAAAAWPAGRRRGQSLNSRAGRGSRGAMASSAAQAGCLADASSSAPAPTPRGLRPPPRGRLLLISGRAPRAGGGRPSLPLPPAAGLLGPGRACAARQGRPGAASPLPLPPR